MFTGIVQGTARVIKIDDQPGLRRVSLAFPEDMLAGLAVGASVAIAGTCLTVTSFEGDQASFDLIDETLRLTTLGGLGLGSTVNAERSLSFGAEIGGHVLSGHVHGTGEVVARRTPQNNVELVLSAPVQVMDYLFDKGFVGVDGCSLTIGRVDRAANTFSVHLIPETLRVTTLGELALGGSVNIEVDAMTQAAVDTVRRVLEGMGLRPEQLRAMARAAR